MPVVRDVAVEGFAPEICLGTGMHKKLSSAYFRRCGLVHPTHTGKQFCFLKGGSWRSLRDNTFAMYGGRTQIYRCSEKGSTVGIHRAPRRWVIPVAT